jgi:hypothetical protein|nr:MAG TPA: translational regulator [Caudoviricetes sp.]
MFVLGEEKFNPPLFEEAGTVFGLMMLQLYQNCHRLHT